MTSVRLIDIVGQRVRGSSSKPCANSSDFSVREIDTVKHEVIFIAKVDIVKRDLSDINITTTLGASDFHLPQILYSEHISVSSSSSKSDLLVNY